MPRPRGGDWLEDEIKNWKLAGIGTLVSALTSEEVSELDLGREGLICQELDIGFVSLPIQDRGLPKSQAVVAEIVAGLASKLRSGGNIGIHCRQGIGRSALLAACVLSRQCIAGDEAFGRIAKARGAPVPDTAEQKQWVERFVRDYPAAPN